MSRSVPHNFQQQKGAPTNQTSYLCNYSNNICIKSYVKCLLFGKSFRINTPVINQSVAFLQERSFPSPPCLLYHWPQLCPSLSVLFGKVFLETEVHLTTNSRILGFPPYRVPDNSHPKLDYNGSRCVSSFDASLHPQTVNHVHGISQSVNR